MKNLFGGVYKNKTVLITGNTGFKGSWLALWLNEMGANVIGYSINKVSSPSHFSLLNLKYKTYFKDILDKGSLKNVFLKHQPEIVFHLAAQSLVRESYLNPHETYEVNLIGTLNVFEAARKCKSVKAIVNVTTDKVYENLEKNISYKESDRLGGFDLYSSSKACSEILTASYRRAFFFDNKILLATARAGNVIGGGDWANDRLIPDLIKSTHSNKKAQIRNPYSVRPWQHVLEPLSGYLLVGQKLLEKKKTVADAFNFGPSEASCITTSEILNRMKKQWNKIDFRISENKNKNYHEAGILKLNYSKSKKELGWKPIWNIHETIVRTSQWYQQFYEKKHLLSHDDLNEYINSAIKQKSIWLK